MKFNELNLTANKKITRVGRGIAAGKGKTAGRGTKGQNSRAGSGSKPGFEGGQNPLMQKLPKLRGFTSHRPKVVTITTSQLNKLGLAKVDNFALAEAGLLENPHQKAKLVLKEKIAKKITVSLQAASPNAIESIKQAGGSFTVVPQIARVSKKTNDKK